MSEENQNKRHSTTAWESSKSEAGLVAAGAVLGGVAGVGGGYIVAQAFGTPPVPTYIIGGTVGVALGGGTAAYAASRMHEARAEAARYADVAIDEAIVKAIAAGEAEVEKEKKARLAAAPRSNGAEAKALLAKAAMQLDNMPAEMSSAIQDVMATSLDEVTGHFNAAAEQQQQFNQAILAQITALQPKA